MLQLIARLVMFLERPYRNELSCEAQRLLSKIEAAGKDGLAFTGGDQWTAPFRRARAELVSHDLIKIKSGRILLDLPSRTFK